MKNFILFFILSFILVNTASADIFSSDKFTLRAGLSFNLTQIHTDRLSTGGFNDKKRVSFENYGGSLFIGFEEIKPFKEMHPIFLEVGYSYMHSYKVSILDATNSAEVITLSEGDSNDFSGQYIIVRAGMELF